MQLLHDLDIKKGGPKNRSDLLRLKKDKNLGIGAKVVYIYSLKDETINYPLKNGNIIYIGEACRPEQETGIRFAQHVSYKSNKGGDTGSNYTISKYYWLNKILNLKIYTLSESENNKEIEKLLLQKHIKEYGALPIAQGAGGENFTIDIIESLDTSKINSVICNL
jgi:hypothetical protein